MVCLLIWTESFLYWKQQHSAHNKVPNQSVNLWQNDWIEHREQSIDLGEGLEPLHYRWYLLDSGTDFGSEGKKVWIMDDFFTLKS